MTDVIQPYYDPAEGLNLKSTTFVHPAVAQLANNACETQNMVTPKAKQYIQSAVDGLNKALTARTDAACAASLGFVNQMLLEAKNVLGNSTNTRNLREAVNVLQRTANTIREQRCVKD
jgi:hypothetical protein